MHSAFQVRRAVRPRLIAFGVCNKCPVATSKPRLPLGSRGMPARETERHPAPFEPNVPATQLLMQRHARKRDSKTPRDLLTKRAGSTAAVGKFLVEGLRHFVSVLSRSISKALGTILAEVFQPVDRLQIHVEHFKT